MYCDQYASLIPVSFVLGEVASRVSPSYFREKSVFHPCLLETPPFLPSLKSNLQGFPLLNAHLEDAHMTLHPETLDITWLRYTPRCPVGAPPHPQTYC